MKVRDYGALLKLARYEDCLPALQRLLMVFVTLAPSGIYAKSVTLYLLLLNHWNKHFPDVAKIWQQNLAAFIEEDGELSFSVLSRTVLADSSKSSFDTLDRAYKGQQLYKTAMVDLEQDLHSFTRTASLHVILGRNSAEVQCLSKFLQQHVQSLRTGFFSIYSKLGRGVISYPGPDVQPTTLSKVCLSNLSIQKNKQLELIITEFEPPYLKID